MQTFLEQFSFFASGFSIVALLLLAIQSRAESNSAKILARTLLGVLLVIQLLQSLYVVNYISLTAISAFIYLVLLGLVGPLFYLYVLHTIQPAVHWSRREYIYLIPAIVLAATVWFLPEMFRIAYALTFFIGGVFMARLAWLLFNIRKRRTLFNLEFFLIASFLAWAIIVTFIGVMSVQMVEQLISLQIILLALAVAAAVHIQLNYPHMLSTLEELAQKHYQTSTLLNVDCDAVKKQLEALMDDKQIYHDSDLSLTMLAESVDLKPHQLSELMNTHLGMNFSVYLRQQRVKAAEAMLVAEPEASVLAIGLAVGFRSQSAFYSAFKEVHGMAPGQFRHQ